MNASGPRAAERMPRSVLAALFVVSVAMLALEIAEVRVFSYSIDPLLVFSAISVALLGLGAGGIVVAVRPALAVGEVRGRLAICLAGFAASALAVHAIFARTSASIGFGSSAGILRTALPIFALFVVPYLFAGVFLSIAMTRWIADVGRSYFANLAGSALGGVVVYPLLRPFGVEAALAAVAALAALSAVPLAWSSGARVRAVAAAVALASVAAVPAAARLFPFQPDPGDLYAVARAALEKHRPGTPEREYEPVRELSRWDPVSRIEVYAFPGTYGKLDDEAPIRFFAQDGGAGSILFSLDGHERAARALFEDTVYGGAYLLRPRPASVLAIGLGGAPDVQAALHHGAGKITGVEINRTTIDVVRGPYARFTGDPYGRPNVTIVHRDGRSFVERTTERYDVIQMSGTDTYSAGASGAFMFSESYLYTEEAFRRYWRALADDGVLAIIRFGLEPLRVVSTELAALRELGVAHPERHFAVLGQGIMVEVLLSRRELSADDANGLVASVVAANAAHGRVHIPVYDAMGFGFADPLTVLYAPGLTPPPGPYGAVLEAAARGEEARVLATMPLDFSPVSDDRPFFFQFLGPRQLASVFRAGEDSFYVRGFRAHLSFLAAIGAVAAALTLLPLVALRRRSVAFGACPKPGGGAPTVPPAGRRAGPSDDRGALRTLGYFAALGFGYLFVELTLMQKSAIFLGHPTYSIAVTLVALLVASGAGAAFATRRTGSAAKVARAGALATVALLGVAYLGMSPLFSALLPAPFALRVVVLALAMLPLGFAMGMPFPVGLRATAAHGDAAVAWALGVNGFSSVVASLLAVPLAMFWGFSAVLGVAVLLYVGAAALAPSGGAS